MRRSASSSFAWQKRESCTPRSKSASDFSSARSPSSSFLTIVSSSAIADSKSLMVGIGAHEFGSRFRTRVHVGPSQADLAVGERHLDAVAGRQRRRVADDRGAVLVPAHSVAAAEHGERAEVSSRPASARSGRRRGRSRRRRRRCQPSVGAASAGRGSPRGGGRRSRCFEPLPQRADARAARRSTAPAARRAAADASAPRRGGRASPARAGKPASPRRLRQHVDASRRRCRSRRAPPPRAGCCRADRCGCRTRPWPRPRSRRPPTASARAGRRRSRRS